MLTRNGVARAVAVCLLPAAAAGQTLVDQVEGQEGMFGSSVSHVGDIDEDGWIDYAVGSPWEAADRGVARVVSGRTGETLRSATGLAPGDRMGQVVAGVGDVNDDGVPDFAASATSLALLTLKPGYVRVFSGADASVLHTFQGLPNENFGASLCGPGDVDQDGYDDIIVGAPELAKAPIGAGFARVYSGQTGAVLCTLLGDEGMDMTGSSVVGVGDNDGDGYPDFAIGAPQLLFTGFVVVVSSKPLLEFVQMQGDTDVVSDPALLGTGIVLNLFTGPGLAEAFGASICSLPDVTGDGRRELAVGAPRAIGGRGAVLTFSGSGRLLWGALGDPGDRLGASLASDFDLSGDGIADLACGAPQVDISLLNGAVTKLGNGRVRLYRGHTGGEFGALNGPLLGSEFGITLSGAGPGAMGQPRLVVGVPNDEPNGPMSGSVWVYGPSMRVMMKCARSGSPAVPVSRSSGAGDRVVRSTTRSRRRRRPRAPRAAGDRAGARSGRRRSSAR
jgi:hypothetical protein